jgi:hypothetical protein
MAPYRVITQWFVDKTFYGKLKPVSENWIPEALAVSGFTREETLAFDDPRTVMEEFASWRAKTSERASVVRRVEAGRRSFVRPSNTDWASGRGATYVSKNSFTRS